MTVRLGDGVSTVLQCSTDNGKISPKKGLSQVEASGGRLKATQGAGEGKLTIETGNGSIEIR